MVNQPKPILLSHYIYMPQAIQEAIASFSNHCHVSSRMLDDSTELEVSPLVQTDVDIVGEFLNYILGLSAKSYCLCLA